ncbi:MAG: hypothetical protein M3O33_01195 [Cyanobacteriota bacterium]|nr:hypothetical protein [Cyanobacteriota bacterium]
MYRIIKAIAILATKSHVLQTMLKCNTFTAVVSTVLLALTTSCASSEPSQTLPSTPTSPKVTTPASSPVASKASSPKLSPTPKPERFQEALDSAMGAATIAQSAESKDDWNLVASRWQSAIALLKTVPKSSSNYAKAQTKIPEYQRNLAYAQQQIKNPSKPKIVALAPIDVAAASNPKTPSTATVSTAPSQTSASVVAAKVALATHLKQIGAKFYGTYWCPYCNKQKELFSQQAVSQINYIECDPQGKNPRPDLCRKAKISAFPTWEINGRQYPGMQPLDQLANLSGYQGDRNFGK